MLLSIYILIVSSGKYENKPKRGQDLPNFYKKKSKTLLVNLFVKSLELDYEDIMTIN